MGLQSGGEGLGRGQPPHWLCALGLAGSLLYSKSRFLICRPWVLTTLTPGLAVGNSDHAGKGLAQSLARMKCPMNLSVVVNLFFVPVTSFIFLWNDTAVLSYDHVNYRLVATKWLAVGLFSERQKVVCSIF